MRAPAALREPIAVIGLACRLPQAPDARAFWNNLRAGVVTIRETPAERWQWTNAPTSDDRSARQAGYIDDIDRFDARLFGISPREAEWMDPQHRILLELSWACLEDAAYTPTALWGKSVGVYVGVSNADYRDIAMTARRREDAHMGLGLAVSIVANRISSHYNWHGPSLSVDTACSSSLVALHQAIRDLRSGDCAMAMVGGVNVCLRPTVFNIFASAGMLSPDGRCRTFDAGASGYVRGEGAATVLLKPLSAALADGDRVYGVIHGSAVNHGGAAVPITAPNPFAQALVIAKAYRDAAIGPDRVSYVEAHGTGTPLGDPIEIIGLKRAFARLAREAAVTPGETRVRLGAVKTQIGHLEPAAGIAGLVKVLLALVHEELPGL